MYAWAAIMEYGINYDLHSNMYKHLQFVVSRWTSFYVPILFWSWIWYNAEQDTTVKRVHLSQGSNFYFVLT